MNLIQLDEIVDAKKVEVKREFYRHGYVENLGQKQAREVDEACTKLAHDPQSDWNDRQLAGMISSGFHKWLDNL